MSVNLLCSVACGFTDGLCCHFRYVTLLMQIVGLMDHGIYVDNCFIGRFGDLLRSYFDAFSW